MLLFFESLPEISVNTELSFSSAMVFVWFFKRFVIGLLFFAERFAFLDTLDSLEIDLCFVYLSYILRVCFVFVLFLQRYKILVALSRGFMGIF